MVKANALDCVGLVDALGSWSGISLVQALISTADCFLFAVVSVLRFYVEDCLIVFEWFVRV